MAIDKPHSDEIERAVLGSLMTDPDKTSEIALTLRPDDFFVEKNRWIYEAILDLGCKADLLTVSDCLARKGVLIEAGGDAYLAEVGNSVPTALNLDQYASLCADLALRRRLIRACEVVAKLSFDQKNSTEDISNMAMVFMEDAISHRGGKGDVISSGELIDQFSVRMEKEIDGGKEAGILSGIVKLDEIIDGWLPSTMNVISGAPGAGKTSLVTQALLYAARHGEGCILFALEMTKEKMVERFLSLMSGVPYKRIGRPACLTTDELVKVNTAQAEFSKLPVFIVDNEYMTVPGMVARVILAKRRRKISLVAVDQLQLISPVERHHDKRTEVVEITSALHKLPKRVGGAALLAVSQLSRSGYSGGKPTLRDLKESGSIESDADTVTFLSIPDEKEPNVVLMDVQKNRNGTTGSASLYFNRGISEFKLPQREKLDDLVYGKPMIYSGNGNGNGRAH